MFVDGERICEVFPLDRLANNKRLRRELEQPEPPPPRMLKGPLDHITDEYRELVASFEDDQADAEDDERTAALPSSARSRSASASCPARAPTHVSMSVRPFLRATATRRIPQTPQGCSTQ